MGAHQFDFLHKTKGAGAGDFVDIGFSGEVDFKRRRTAVEHGMVEFNGQRYFEAVVRSKTHPFAGFFDFYGFEDFQKPFLRLLVDDSRIL